MLDDNEPQLLKFADLLIIRELDRHNGDGVAWWDVPCLPAIATKRHNRMTLIRHRAGHTFLSLHRLLPCLVARRGESFCLCLGSVLVLGDLPEHPSHERQQLVE